MIKTTMLAAFIMIAIGFASLGCAPTQPNALDQLGTVRVVIQDQPFELWIADNDDEREKGLMFITKEQMAPLPDGTERGMIFVFDRERYLSFWMKNTIIPLDIAYLTTSGKVVSIHTMAPLDERSGNYPSGKPSRFAIEVNANVYSRLGLESGNVVTIPDSVLNPTS